MQPVLNVEDVRKVEEQLTLAGVSLVELMRRAGHAAAEEILGLDDVKHATIFCGLGNNGGDGWVASELLKRAGMEVEVICPDDPKQLKSSLALMVATSAIGADVSYHVAPSRDELDDLLAQSDCVLDALLGTGFHGEPQAPFDIWIDAINSSGLPVVAVDVPSGLSAQTGHAPGAVVYADVTVTMISLKPGLLSGRGRDVCGQIVLAPLADQTDELVLNADPVAWRCETADYVDVLQLPSLDIDKFARGSVLVVGGSQRYSGAPLMCALAAARAGAGYVTVAVPQCIATVSRAHMLEVPVVSLPTTPEGCFSSEAKDQIVKLAKTKDAVVVGPGMGANAETAQIVSALLETDVPLVIDADGLNALARLSGGHLEDFPELIRREAPLVLTPHRRELGRLVGLAQTPPDSLTSALEAARRIVWADGGSQLCIMAKGEATACVGVEIALLPKPGPQSLATAGSGDVLAGIVASLLAQTTLETDALPLLAAFAAEIHGAAATLAAERYGTRGVMASDLIDSLGLARDAFEEQVSLAAAAE